MASKIFSERIKKIRLDNDLTMNEFAKLLNVTKSRINMWENNGTVPREDILIKLSNRFDVSIDYLLGNEKTEGNGPENQKLKDIQNITLMCGLPRSGKSTWIKNNRNNEIVLSADSLRWLVYNKRFWEDGESLLWYIDTLFLKYLLKQKVDIIIDEINTTKKRRKRIIDIAKKHNYQIKVIVFTTTKDECIKRAKLTNQLDLIDVINRHDKIFEMPSEYEGIDCITIWEG
jgi:predicted kinase/DNA-binding XRE family transcriptional regulator